jgi:hypothetical protein
VCTTEQIENANNPPFLGIKFAYHLQNGKQSPTYASGITPGPNIDGVWIQPRPDIVFADIQHGVYDGSTKSETFASQLTGTIRVMSPQTTERSALGENVAYFIHASAFLSG